MANPELAECEHLRYAEMWRHCAALARKQQLLLEEARYKIEEEDYERWMREAKENEAVYLRKAKELPA